MPLGPRWGAAPDPAGGLRPLDPPLRHLRTIASRLLLVVSGTSRFYSLLNSSPELLYSIIPILITFEKISIRMTIVIKLTTLMIGRYTPQIFQGQNKHSEDLINNFEQF